MITIPEKAFGVIKFVDRVMGTGNNQARDLVNVRFFARADYMDGNNIRFNDGDNPVEVLQVRPPILRGTHFPETGRYEWIHGHDGNHNSAIGEKIGNNIVYEMRYIPSEEDKEWVRQRNINRRNREGREIRLAQPQPTYWHARCDNRDHPPYIGPKRATFFEAEQDLRNEERVAHQERHDLSGRVTPTLN